MKIILDPHLKLHTKMRSKWVVDSSAGGKTKTKTKPLRRKKNIHTFGLDKNYLGLKRKVDKFDSIKIKNFCSKIKNYMFYKRIKRQITVKEILSTHKSDKWLASRIIKELLGLNIN